MPDGGHDAFAGAIKAVRKASGCFIRADNLTINEKVDESSRLILANSRIQQTVPRPQDKVRDIVGEKIHRLPCHAADLFNEHAAFIRYLYRHRRRRRERHVREPPLSRADPDFRSGHFNKPRHFRIAFNEAWRDVGHPWRRVDSVACCGDGFGPIILPVKIRIFCMQEGNCRVGDIKAQPLFKIIPEHAQPVGSRRKAGRTR